MKNKLFQLFSFIFIFALFTIPFILFSGCASRPGDESLLTQEEWERLEEIAGDIWQEYRDSKGSSTVPVENPEPTPTPEPDGQGYFSWPTNYSDRNYTFYWKSKAEDRNHAAVLLSSKHWGNCETIELWHNGILLERINYHTSTKDGKPNPGVNGNRTHFYLKKLGRDYPNGTIVRHLLLSGGHKDISVPNTSVKFYKEDR
ncbi:hypothetical protein P0Y35_08575 [Kiritimatiellaeota bacterium B1221]|nr:hypothetical protein [Kiritimatiellaeota bacterium B1221]